MDLQADHPTKGVTRATSLLGGEFPTNRLTVIEEMAAATNPPPARTYAVGKKVAD
jgi:hypothetical protein